MEGETEATSQDKSLMGQCHKEGVKPNTQAYVAGVKEGIARYCTLEAAEKRGQQGLQFKFDLCTSKSKTELLVSHEKGIRKFCSTSGYSAGASGKPLLVSCPTDTLPVFNSEFQRGRTDYLLHSVEKLNAQLSSMREQIKNLEEQNEDLERKNRNLETVNRNLEREIEDTKRRLSN